MKELTKTELKIAKLFRTLYVGTDCQTTFKVGEVCDMIKDCFPFKGDDVSKGDKILNLTVETNGCVEK